MTLERNKPTHETDNFGGHRESAGGCYRQALGECIRPRRSHAPSLTQVDRALGELERAGIMAPFRDSKGADLKLSATSRRVARWRLIDPWPERLDAPMHQDWGLAYLLQRFPLVETFYPAANRLQDDSTDDQKQGMGKLIQFKWFQGAPWDAAVRYEKGWAAIFFSGILETEAHLRDRMVRLGPELMECTLTTAAYSDNVWAWPGLLVFVVPDQWQRELVKRVAGSYIFAPHVQVHCISDDSVEGPELLGTSRKWVGQGVRAGRHGRMDSGAAAGEFPLVKRGLCHHLPRTAGLGRMAGQQHLVYPGLLPLTMQHSKTQVHSEVPA